MGVSVGYDIGLKSHTGDYIVIDTPPDASPSLLSQVEQVT